MASQHSNAVHRLLLLRHGEVASHRGDVPVTEAGLAFAKEVGRRLGASEGPFSVLSGETLRTRQTALAITDGARSVGATVSDPRVSFAMRNPDIYVAGERVNMVSSPESLALQVDGLTVEKAAAVPFFREFFTATDRVGFGCAKRIPLETTLQQSQDAF